MLLASISFPSSASLLAEGLLQQVVVLHIRRWAQKHNFLLSYFLLSSNLEPVEKGLAIDTCFRGSHCQEAVS